MLRAFGPECKSKFPSGMTTRKASAEAGSLREWKKEKQVQQQLQLQIPTG
jgi:hypothetical protein